MGILKYWFHYVIVIPALILIFVFKIIPFLSAVYIPFVDYQVFKGIFGSPLTGMDNFSRLFDDPALRKALFNTLIIKIVYILVCSIFALVVSLSLSGIASAKLRNVFSMLFALPLFIPSAVFAYVVMIVLSQNSSPFPIDTLVLAEPSLFRPILVVTEVVKTCGIPILIALAAIGAKHAAMSQNEQGVIRTDYMQANLLPAVRAVAAFMILQLSTLLTTDFELLHTLLHPLVFEVGDTLDTFGFRVGFMQMEMGVAGMIGFVQFIVQLLFTLLAYLLIRGFFADDLFAKYTPSIQAKDRAGSVAGIGLSAVYSVVILFLLYMLFVHPFAAKGDSGIGVWELLSAKTFILYLLITLASVLVHLFMTLTLAYPLTVKDLPGRSVFKAFLLVVMLMGSGTISEFIFLKNMGMLNTYFPYAVTGFFSIVSVFVLKSIFNSKYSELREEASAKGHGEPHIFFYLFIPKVWKSLIALGILQFVMVWNSYLVSLIYIANPEQASPVLLFKMLSSGGFFGEVAPGDPVIMQLGALISLPGILLLLIFRKLLTSEVMISQSRRL